MSEVLNVGGGPSARQRLKFATAQSDHPEPAVALGEAVGSVVEQIGPAPDLAVLLVSGASSACLGDVVDAVHTLLCPTTLIAAVVPGLLPSTVGSTCLNSVGLFVGNPGVVQPIRLDIADKPGQLLDHSGVSFAIGDLSGFGPAAMLDPASTQGGAFLGVDVGPVSRQGGPPGLWMDDTSFSDGAIGFSSAQSDGRAALARGFRPLGQPLTITEMNGDKISRLAGETAAEQLGRVLDELTKEERGLAKAGLGIGILVGEQDGDQSSRTYVVQDLIGTTPSGCLVATEDPIDQLNHLLRSRFEVGSVAQFHVRDPEYGQFPLVGPNGSPHEARSGALAFTTGPGSGADLDVFSEFGVSATLGGHCRSLIFRNESKIGSFDSATAVLLLG